MRFKSFQSAFLSISVLAFKLLMSPVSYAENYVVVVKATDDIDSTSGNSDDFAIKRGLQLNKLSPNTKVVIVSGATNKSINKGLQDIVNGDPKAKISGLYVIAHGVGEHTKPFQNEKDFGVKISSSKGGFNVDLLNRHSVASAFSPIMDRFSNNATIIFNSCKLLSYGDDQLKVERARKVASNMGLEDGVLFLAKDSISRLNDERELEWNRNRLSARYFSLLAMTPITWTVDRFSNEGLALEVNKEKYRVSSASIKTFEEGKQTGRIIATSEDLCSLNSFNSTNSTSHYFDRQISQLVDILTFN